MIQFYNDPMKDMREKFDSADPGTISVGGKIITSKEQLKEAERVIQNFIRIMVVRGIHTELIDFLL